LSGVPFFDWYFANLFIPEDPFQWGTCRADNTAEGHKKMSVLV